MTPPKLILILSENWTLTSPRDLRSIVRFAVEAEDAGFDAVMVSEHVVLGPDADAERSPVEPARLRLAREPGSRDAVAQLARAAVRRRGRHQPAAAGGRCHHPAPAPPAARGQGPGDARSALRGTAGRPADRELAPSEYDALGVPFGSRGELLDEHLAAWNVLWRDSPASFDGTHYRFHDVYLEPKPFRPEGPTLWFGGSSLHDRLVDRIVAYGDGFNPFGRPSAPGSVATAEAMAAAGRSIDELEMVGGTRGVFPDPSSVADLAQASPRSRNRSRLGSRRSASSRPSSSTTPAVGPVLPRGRGTRLGARRLRT